MKIAYLGKIQLSDTDLSYLNSAEKLNDITYYLEVTPRFLKGPAFNIEKIYPKSGIFRAIDVYPDFQKYSALIDVDNFFVVNTCGKFWQIKAFWTNLLLLFHLIKNKYDLIHMTWPANIYEFFIYLLKKKLILTVHDPFPHSGLDTHIVRLRRWAAFHFVKHFIILNKAQLKKFLSYYGLNNAQVSISELSCFPYMKIVADEQSETKSKEEYILFAGKISPYKGVSYLVKAMQHVHDHHPDIKLIIAGSGKFNFDISEYQNEDFIEIRNRFIPDDELVILLKNAKFVVCPYTDATQSGVIMSAFTFSTPVLATNVGGLPDMLNNQQFGMIVKEKDVDALANGISHMLDDEKLLTKYRQNISNAYTGGGEHSWKTIALKLNNVYKKIYNKQ